MRVTNWKKKIVAAILAAGIYVPCSVYATPIPVPDANFEAYDPSPHNGGFAYAAAGGGSGSYTGAYRPTSPWVDDLDHFSGAYIQDNTVSNYLYDTVYANAGGRPTPHSADAAMHGLAKYTAQVLPGQVFEAGKTYTLSVWAQDRVSTTFSKGLYMYFFDGSAPFLEATVLQNTFHDGPAIPDRTAAMTSAESQANWVQLSSGPFTPGPAAVGKPIGIGFFLRRGTAIDDVSLDVVPEPASVILVGLSGLTLLGLRRRQ